DGLVAEREATERLFNAGVAVVPGSAFGEGFAGYARLSFSTMPGPQITDGARRFGEALWVERPAMTK
ncbi:MAG TPA: hypothetical protein VHC70_07550, partial [Phycisphaerales bacterium]|nr:hypothetical protein [Phycisphaerales bacterium]